MKIRYLFLLLFALSTSAHAQRKEIVLATYIYSTNNRLANLQPLAEWLSAKTGYIIKAKSYPTVQALQQAIVDDSVDFAMMNTSGYMVLQRNHPGIAIPFVNLSMGNTPTTQYGGCIITSKQTGISTLADLATTKALSIALVNASSTSGNLVPRLLLNQSGIPELEKIGNVHYSGTHKKVVEEILSGQSMIGGCGCAEVDSARKNNAFDDKAIVLGSFNDIPLGPIVYRKSVPEQLHKRIAVLLLELHTQAPSVFTNFLQGWTEFRQATYFQPVSDEHYSIFRKLFGDNVLLWKMIE